MGDSKTITVETTNGPVVVKKLALREYALMMRAMNKLPQNIGQFLSDTDTKDIKEMDMGGFMAVLPSIIGDSLDEFAEILAVATDKDVAFFLESDDLPGTIDVGIAAFELNDYRAIYNSIKKAMSRMQPQDHKAKK